MRRRRIHSRSAGLVIPFVGVLMCAYFVWHGLHGANGYLARERLEVQAAELQAELADVQEERRRLERQVALLRPESLDPDMLEERARAILNLADPHDVVIMRGREQPGD
ncbi:FtsB family cell division protein [Lutibaculum baratangense]|uniref:Cell division protein DivIC (FtsB), stabilizes FtsL against RasP cleavage n=1 Tax=Lutibaculum baratangense AMV1 TaxID=631454 RepID=V4TAP4_9HYPH|nr:septum formation initiator family protein [Lutibaculum baratangense]ESR23503.1 Cell division protein DivIC (FtsB), stabilizes FtsL against RasP cleavage [Lutibaculum baratangense AMV1]